MNFERGIDPKEAIGLGYKEVLKSMKGCLLLTEKDLYQNINNQYHNIETVSIKNFRVGSQFLYHAFVIIVIVGDKFRIFKNRISDDNEIYSLEDLPEMVFKLKKAYDEWFAIRKMTPL